MRPMTEDNWDLLLRWNNDPEVLYYSEGDEVYSRTLAEVQAIYRGVSQQAICFIAEVGGMPIGEGWLQRLNLLGMGSPGGQGCKRAFHALCKR